MWGAAGALTTAGVGAYASSLAVTDRTLTLPNWDADGFRVAHLSDVHLNNDGLLAVARRAVDLVVRAKPDLVVFTGDFLNFDQDDCYLRIGKAFERLHDLACPCLAVFGNHDYGSAAPGRVAEALASTKFRLLVNEESTVDGVRVIGLDDALAGSPDFGLVSKHEGRSTLVLLHEPDYAAELGGTAGLVLSGHSHGGEVCLPTGRPLYTPRGARTYRSGFYADAPSPVYVNRGTATLGPIRLFCPPEVAILTLRGNG